MATEEEHTTPEQAPVAASATSSRVLGNGQRAAALVVGFGMALAGLYGLVISYLTVLGLAAERGMPLPHVYPLGIEGGFIAVLALDLLLIWVQRPIGWLRQVARLLAVAAVGLNAAAGWVDHGALAAAMHALPPAILIACVEAIRTHLLRMLAEADEFRREPIPKMRWLLAPRSTAVLWRRMVLWQIASYPQALSTDLQRREALALLRREFGRRWKRKIPADVAYRLTVGVDQEQAIARVQSLCADTEHGTAASAPPLDSYFPNGAIGEFLAEGEQARGGVAELPPGGAHEPSAAERFPEHFGERPDTAPSEHEGERSQSRRAERSARGSRGRSGERPRRTPGGRNRKRVAKYLAKHPEATNPEIARALKLGESTVRRIRSELKTNPSTDEQS